MVLPSDIWKRYIVNWDFFKWDDNMKTIGRRPSRGLQDIHQVDTDDWGKQYFLVFFSLRRPPPPVLVKEQTFSPFFSAPFPYLVVRFSFLKLIHSGRIMVFWKHRPFGRYKCFPFSETQSQSFANWLCGWMEVQGWSIESDGKAHLQK